LADMNITPARAGLTPQIWDGKFWAEYIRANRFSKYMGTSLSSMIQVKKDLTVKRGDSITFATVRRLTGAGVTGDTVLEGNEEVLDQRSMKLTVAPIRHAVAVSDWDEQKSSIDLRDAAKSALTNWSMEKIRADIIIALSSINGVAYAAATAAQRNTWLVSNSDRVLFGSSVANGVSGVQATALATLDNTADKMTGAVLSLAKRRAQTASPHIRPIQVIEDSDEEWFVCFMPSLVFRDFKIDPPVLAVNKDARPRENGWANNPLFTGGDLMWDGIIVREIPELPVLTGVGAGAIDAAASFLCGAQALGVGWAQLTKSTTNTRDYDFMHGVGIQEIRAVGKLVFGKDPAVDTTSLVDQGVATIFTAAVADA
jgi:N4-gp56 family major capsid protein